MLNSEYIDSLSFKEIEKIIALGIKETTHKIMNSEIDHIESGSTCNGILLNSKRIICFNIGDSRSVIGRKLGNRNWEAKAISFDHTPSREDERKRIINHGGRVKRLTGIIITNSDFNGNHIGPQRVWYKEIEAPGLAMTRSIGDTGAAKIGVLPNPEFVFRELTHEDKFLIIASDGVWEFISNEEAVSIVLPFYEINDSSEASNALVLESISRWKRRESGIVDDITCIVVFINAQAKEIKPDHTTYQ